MKVVLFCFVFFCLAFCQFDYTSDQLSTLSLSVSEDGSRHDELSDTVIDQQIVNNDCRDAFHIVQNLRTNNGPKNSGTYFSIEVVTEIGNEPIQYRLYNPSNEEFLEIVDTDGSGTQIDSITGQCTASSTCRFDYYCHDYSEVTNNLRILVNTVPDTVSNQFSEYDITFTQYVDVVSQISSSRTFDQSTPVTSNSASSNLGPENFIHYYHNFDAQPGEIGNGVVFFVEVTDFDSSNDGEGFVCISFSDLVATTSSITGSANLVLDNGELDPTVSGTSFSSPSDCQITCARGDINLGSGTIYVPFSPCSLCDSSDLWIGVQTPSTDSTYTINIRSFGVPSVTSVVSFPFEAQGTLDGDCDIYDNDYSCEDYYYIGNPIFGDNSYFRVELYGLHEIDAEVFITSNYLGGQSQCCGEDFGDCSVTAGDDQYCTVVVQSCEYSEDTEFYVTVVYDSGTVSANYDAFYGLKISSGTFETTTVDPFDEPATVHGTVIPLQYHHYAVDFTNYNIDQTTNFIAEMYVDNAVDQDIEFAWNYASEAGDSTCYDFSGICITDTTCNDYDYLFNSGGIPICRFQFLPCPSTFGDLETDFENNYPYPYYSTFSDNQGFHRGELFNGIYYFSVSSQTFTEFSVPEVEFTLVFTLQLPITLYENIPLLGEVYRREYTAQYVVHIPDDQSITGVFATIDNVQNGGVTLAINSCNPAGFCPCYNFFDACSVSTAYEYSYFFSYVSSCSVTIPLCAFDVACGDERVVYLSVFGEYTEENYSYNMQYAPTFFTLTTHFQTIENSDSIIPITPSFDGTVTTGIIYEDVYRSFVTLSVPDSTNFESKFVDYYSITLDNYVGDADIFFTLTILNNDLTNSEYVNGEYGFSNSRFGELEMILSKNYISDYYPFVDSDDHFHVCDETSCIASNRPITDPEDSFFGNPYEGTGSFCTIAIRSCASDCSPFPGVDTSATYYISIYAVDPFVGFVSDKIIYTLQAKYDDLTPYQISDSIAIQGTIEPLEYKHFEYNIGSVPSNSRLIMELFRRTYDGEILRFYANYFDGVGEPVLAGLTGGCYDSFFCRFCELSAQRMNKCLYDVPPCVLSQQSGGTYYMSVLSFFNNEIDIDYNGEYYDEYTGQFVRHDYIYDSFIGHVPAEFTIEARIEEITQIDVSVLDHPVVYNLFPGETSYYRISVPSSTSGNVIANIFNLAVTSYNEHLHLFLSTSDITPSEVCYFPTITLPENSVFYFNRNPCELEDNTYYLAVSSDTSLYYPYYAYEGQYYPEYLFDNDCDHYEFSIHSSFTEVHSIDVQLSNNDVDPRIDESYDSTLSTDSEENSITLSHNEYFVVEFQISASQGEFFAVKVQQDISDDQENYSIYLNEDDFYLPPSTGSDSFGIDSVDTSSCAGFIQSRENISDDTEQILIVQPCDVDQGTTTWYLTLVGEGIGFNSKSGIISIVIEKYTTETINVPASDVFTGVTTSLTFGDSDVDEYSYTTLSSLGLSGGEELEFQVTNADQLYVRYNGETGPGECDVSCESSDLGSTQSCSIYACDNISQDDWFIYIIGDNSASGTFTITRSAASPSDPNDITTLTLNNVQTFSSLSGSGDDYDNEFQYFQFTIPASDESRFELETNGIDSSDIYYVSSTSDVTFMPGFTASGADEYVMFSGGATDTSTCGAFQLGSLPTADCCYDTLTYVFAVVGSTGGDYDLNPTVFDHISNTNTVSLPASVSETVLADTIDLITFNVNNGDDFYFEFAVTTGNADIYLNRGDIAGSDDQTMNEPGYCWNNDGIVGSSLCPSSVSSGNSCSGLRYACLESCAPSNTPGTLQYTFAIAANADTDYTLEIIAQSTSTLNIGSNSISFPEDLSINDDSDFNDNFGVISQYVFTYNEDPNNEFSPLLNDDTFTDDFYPRIQFVFDNFEDASDNTPVDASELTIFIQSGSPAGSPSCLSGSDITSGRSFLPCMENGSGAADETTSDITCTINLCDLSCGEQIYFGVARSSNVETNYNFDITITELYDDLEDNGELNLLTLNGADSVSFGPVDSNDSIYIEYNEPSLNPGQYVITTFSVEGDVSTELDLESIGSQCVATPNIICDDIDTTEDCIIISDPCTSKNSAIDPQTSYYRVTRDEGVNSFSFTITTEIVNISPIDSSETRLTPITDPSYSAEKTIEDLTWHFYEFFVTENDGYTTLEVTVSDLLCESNSEDLEVYMSWGDESGNFGDVSKSGYWPTSSCNNFDSTSSGGVTSFAMDTCQFNAGSYRVGIFAPEGTAQFPDELDDGEIYSTRYSISAQLTTLDHVELTVDCVYSQLVNSEDFVPRFEVNIPATGPGFDLYFIVTYDHDEDDSLDSNLYLSDTYPTGNTAYCTPFGGRDDAIYTATDSDTTFMFISLDSCESIDGTYYLYIDGLEEDDDEGVLSIQVSAQIFGTQVIDLTSSASYSTDRYLSTSSGIPFGRHVYKIIVDESTPFSVNVQLAPCDDRTIWAEQDFSALEANVYIIGGGNGRFGKTLYYGDADNGICDTCGDIIYNCDLDDEDTYSCDYFNCGSTYGYYYLIIADELNDAGRTEIEYILNVNTVEQTSAISLSVGEYHNVQRGENYVFNLQNSNAEYELEVTSLSTDLTYSIYGTDLSSCFTTTCDFNVCSDFFDICDVAIPGQLYLFIDNDEYRECFDFVESVTVILRETTFDTTSISLNSPVSNSAEYGVISSSNQWLVTDANNAVSYTYYSEAASCSSGCDFVLEDSGLSGTHTYYIDTPPTGFTVSPLSIQTVSVGTSTTHTFSNNGDILNFEFSIPNDRQTSYVIYVENVSFSALDGDLETDIVFRYNLGSQPSYGCEVGGICGGSFTALTASCDSAFSPIGVSPCESNGSYYLSLALCSDITCDVDFSLRIIDVSETSSLQSGVNHASAYTSVSVTTPSACSSSSVDLVNSLAISNVDELFYVSLRNVRGGSVTVEHNHALDSCLSGDSCTAFESQFGYDCSCNLGADDCISSAMCGENNPSSTEVVFTASNPGVYYEYQIITQYVDIAPNSGSVSTTIIGETAHFYRITNSNQALSIDLTMQYGPALTMTLIAGCEYGDREFFEKRVCVAGTCSMYIATESEQPGGDSMYLALESSAVTTYDNEYYEKEASYSLSVTGGAANCVPASQAGICSEYLSDYSNSMVWNFNEGSNYISDRIDCALDYFVGEYEDRTCHRPTTECTNAIKGLLCLYFSPQCSSNGYQMNMCQDYCFEVAKQCDILPETNVIGFNCYATFFNEGTAGSCYSNSTFTSTPEEFNPRQFFEDNANPDTVAQPIPAITTTYFPPVVATMPPLILDDDDGNKKDMIHDVEQKVTEEQVGASSRDVISVSLFIFSLLISLFA